MKNSLVEAAELSDEMDHEMDHLGLLGVVVQLAHSA